MKKMLLLCFSLMAGAIRVFPATLDINFQSSELDELKDSFGNDLTESFTFQMGTFDGTFAPSDDNVADWEGNWRVFEQADFNDVPPPLVGFTTTISDQGFSGSTNSNADTAYDFSGQEAWLWVFNGRDVEASGTEWFLGRADAWTFPTISGDECCGGELPIDWALEDFASETPVWGNQSGIEGFGERSGFDVDFELQTYIVVPEPGTWVLMGIALSTWLGISRIGRKGGRS